MHLITMTVEMLFATKFNKCFADFSYECGCNTLETYLFATFCCDLTAQAKIFEKLMYLVCQYNKKASVSIYSKTK